ncbi:MAG: flagellar hook-basal body complex protein [Planctomycetes bacterium]|nr:flagellar hook-basal body complex protein [Planctomycetota bacterium]
MQNALVSALSGLRVNQKYLDVIGNNLANANTNGFRASRVSFVDLFGQAYRPASGPTGLTGGRNPSEIGSGAGIGSVDVRMVQGSLLNTGRNLDLGIQGEGFFVVSDGNQNFYTRVGAFGVDANDNFVDLRTGYRVQNSNGTDITIQLNTVIPAEASTNVELQGNLPAVVSGPLSELLQTDQPFKDFQPARINGNAGPYALNGGETLLLRANFGITQTITLPVPAVPGAMTAAEISAAINAQATGVNAVNNAGSLVLQTNGSGANQNVFIDPLSTGAAAIFAPANIGVAAVGTETTANATTLLSDLSANTVNYIAGDQIRITGSRPDGTPVTGIFVFGTAPGQDGTTLGALMAKMNTMFNSATGGATATLNTDGTISLLSNATGEAALTVTIQDLPASTGRSNWSSHFFRTITQGANPDTEAVTTTVYDSAGQAHAVSFEFARRDDGTWDVTASVDPLEGTVLSGTISGLGFDQNGTLNMVPPNLLQVQWNTVPGVQNLNLNFGSAGQTNGMTQFGLPGSVFGVADGYTAGSLSSVAVRGDGIIEGFYTNGQILDLDNIGVALFKNSAGLTSAGDSLWQLSGNSGDPFITNAQTASAGSIVAGTLEGSNVDIAEEFVRLIEAQRGFQANARIISTTDEILQELVNLV